MEPEAHTKREIVNIPLTEIQTTIAGKVALSVVDANITIKESGLWMKENGYARCTNSHAIMIPVATGTNAAEAEAADVAGGETSHDDIRTETAVRIVHLARKTLTMRNLRADLRDRDHDRDPGLGAPNSIGVARL